MDSLPQSRGGRQTQPWAWSHFALQLPLPAFPDGYETHTEDSASGSTKCPNWEGILCSQQAQA